jgi:uncharacterized RDD family membrane protein YckC
MAMLNRYFTFWPRFWAGCMDVLVLVPVGLADHWLWDQDASTAVRVVWFAFASTAALLYRILLHGLWGQTVGKRIMGIRVLDVSGSALKMWQAILRDSLWLAFTAWFVASQLPWVLRGVDPSQVPVAQMGWLPWVTAIVLLAELMTMLGNARRRALHDLLAGSVVIRQRKRWTAGQGD